MGELHKVFISYHDGRNQPTGGDWRYKDEFVRLFRDRAQVILSRPVDFGDVVGTLPVERIRQRIRDDYLSDTSVTIVLVGAHTWQRKHVDWEIDATIADTTKNPRSGLLGILLPTYPLNPDRTYSRYTVPPRLWDNLDPDCGYAAMYPWTNDAADLQAWVHAAFLRRKTHQPNDRRDLFGRNRTGDRWQD